MNSVRLLLCLTSLIVGCSINGGVKETEVHRFDAAQAFYDAQNEDAFPVFCFAENNCVAPTAEFRRQWIEKAKEVYGWRDVGS